MSASLFKTAPDSQAMEPAEKNEWVDLNGTFILLLYLPCGRRDKRSI